MIFWEAPPEQEWESELLQALLPSLASLHLCQVSLSTSLMYRRKQVGLPGLGEKDGKRQPSTLGIVERFTKGPAAYPRSDLGSSSSPSSNQVPVVQGPAWEHGKPESALMIH